MRAHNRGQSLFLAPAVYGLLGWASMALAADKLGSYAIDQKAISASGVSSGGFMAQQFHVAHSAEIMGAGIVAAGPYNCANSKPGWPAICAAMDVCSHTAAFVPFMGPPNPQRSIRATQSAAKQHKIDPTSGLRHDKVFLFSGMKDSAIPQSVMTSLDEYYSHFIQAQNIVYVTDVPAEHAMITSDFGNDCDVLKTPFINNCNYDLAGKILEHIYPGLNPAGDPATGKMIEFDQTEFFPPGGSVSLNPVGHPLGFECRSYQSELWGSLPCKSEGIGTRCTLDRLTGETLASGLQAVFRSVQLHLGCRTGRRQHAHDDDRRHPAHTWRTTGADRRSSGAADNGGADDLPTHRQIAALA